MTHNAEDAAELIERLEPDEQEQALRIMRCMAAGKPGYRPIDMDEMRTELEGLHAVISILLSELESEAGHIENSQEAVAHAHFAKRVVNLYHPAWAYIYFRIQDLYRRAEEAIS